MPGRPGAAWLLSAYTVPPSQVAGNPLSSSAGGHNLQPPFVKPTSQGWPGFVLCWTGKHRANMIYSLGVSGSQSQDPKPMKGGSIMPGHQGRHLEERVRVTWVPPWG